MQPFRSSSLAPQIEAEILALRALGFVADDSDRLGRFIGATGTSVGDLTRRAGDARFLGTVLDFLLADEPTLMAFTARVGVRPEAPYDARRRLPSARPAAG